MRLTIILLVILSSPVSFSSEEVLIGKVIEYLTIGGYEEMAIESYGHCVSMASQMATDHKELIKYTIEGSDRDPRIELTEEEYSKIGVILKRKYDEYVLQACEGFSPKDELRIVAIEYSKYVTSEDMDAILNFFKSPAGKKDILASKKGIGSAYDKIRNITNINRMKAGKKLALDSKQIILEAIENKN